MPPPCFQRPWHSNSWVGAPFWDILRATPTRPLCPLKNSQLASPAAFAITPSPARGCPYRNRADGAARGTASRMTPMYLAKLRGPAESAGTCRIATGARENSLAQDESATADTVSCCLHQGVRHLVHIMTLWRTTAGINKVEHAGSKDAPISFADALRWVFSTTVPAISNFAVGSARRLDADECR